MEKGVVEMYLIPSLPFTEVLKYGWNSVGLFEIYG
jgi:hypothetical protein